MRLSVIQRLLWGLAGTALLAFAAFQYFEPSTDTDANASNPAFYADFELTDHRGLVQTDEYFAGRWMLVFFGFANCPDVCPTTLAEVAAVMEDLGTDAEKIQHIFISNDPERDTPAALAEYVTLFNAGIIGLSSLLRRPRPFRSSMSGSRRPQHQMATQWATHRIYSSSIQRRASPTLGLMAPLPKRYLPI